MMPFTLLLLELLFDRFLFRLDPFMAGEEPVDCRLQLLNIVERHSNLYRKT